MRAMRLYGISIDEVRDIFGAPPEVAARLTKVFAAGYPAPAMKRRWGLFRRDPSLEVDASKPLPRDAETLLTGGFVPQERLEQSWELLHVWLEELATRSATVAYRRLDAIEFDLARRGLGSTLALGHLGERDLGIPLRPLPGMRAGYSHHSHAEATRAALAGIDPTTLDDNTRAVVTPLLDFLTGLPATSDVVVVDTE